MNQAETLDLLSALKACGATHFKSNDFEITMSPSMPGFPPGAFKREDTTPAAPLPTENKEATERLKELIGTMSLSPEALADKIFPAGAER